VRPCAGLSEMHSFSEQLCHLLISWYKFFFQLLFAIIENLLVSRLFFFRGSSCDLGIFCLAESLIRYQCA
jgi:hypothetical protein